MTKITSQFWIPILRQLTDKIVHTCYGYKKLGWTPFRRSITQELPKDRTEGYRPFQVAPVDFAGSTTQKIEEKKEDNSFELQHILCSDSLSRALYLEILKDQTLID